MLLVVCLVMALVPANMAFAKGKSKKAKIAKVYKDVDAKMYRRDPKSYEAIKFVKSHNGWRGLIKKNRFNPNMEMNQLEVMMVLYNLYGIGALRDNANATWDGDTPATAQFVCDRMVAMSKNLGYKITWQGSGGAMKRKDVARYIKIFATYHPSLMPRRY